MVWHTIQNASAGEHPAATTTSGASMQIILLHCLNAVSRLVPMQPLLPADGQGRDDKKGNDTHAMVHVTPTFFFA